MPPREEVRTLLHRLGESSIQASLEELPLLGEQIYQLSIIAALMISPLRHLKQNFLPLNKWYLARRYSIAFLPTGLFDSICFRIKVSLS